jgi:ABC-type glycerol-3-phosphate transport system permease component
MTRKGANLTTTLLVATLISVLGLVVIAVYRLVNARDWRTGAVILVIGGLGAAFAIGLYNAYAQSSLSRGGSTSHSADLLTVSVLYVCMIAGMLAQYGFRRFEQAERSFSWDQFLAPVFASPIVFIPLLGTLQNADVDLYRLDAARLVIFFVAFENGFFWKDYFDHRGTRRGSRR